MMMSYIITVNHTKTQSAEQQCFYGKFKLQATIKRTSVFM